jgi:FkbM family methyltransferase
MYEILGNWMYLDDKDSLGLAKYGVYEQEETRFIQESIKPSFTAVDVGANIGYYTLIMARLAKHVYAFEPEPKNFEILEKNIAVNGVENVILDRSALSDKNSIGTLHICNFNNGMNRLYPSKWCSSETIQVETMKLDDVVEHADFIKMDIEGAELGALRGMTRLLEKGTTVLMEFHPPSIIEYGVAPKEVYDYMKSFGYRITLPDRKEKDDVAYDELERISTQKVGTNILCVKL